MVLEDRSLHSLEDRFASAALEDRSLHSLEDRFASATLEDRSLTLHSKIVRLRSLEDRFASAILEDRSLHSLEELQGTPCRSSSKAIFKALCADLQAKRSSRRSAPIFKRSDLPAKGEKKLPICQSMSV